MAGRVYEFGVLKWRNDDLSRKIIIGRLAKRMRKDKLIRVGFSDEREGRLTSDQAFF